MSVNALSASDPSTAAASLGSISPNDATEQRFLKLLVTQLNNQDPLNPLDNEQITSQLAQLSTVSGIEKMNTTLNSLLAQSNSDQMLQAASMVDRGVLVPGSTLSLGDGAASDFAVELPASAESVKAIITNAAGTPVGTIDMGAQPSGLHSQHWSGEDASGAALPAGQYHLQVTAANGSVSVPSTTLIYGKVGSVSQDASKGVSLDLSNGQSVSLADVRMLR